MITAHQQAKLHLDEALRNLTEARAILDRAAFMSGGPRVRGEPAWQSSCREACYLSQAVLTYVAASAKTGVTP